MNTLEIKIALMRLGIKQRQIAEQLNLDPSTVCQVINNKRTSRNVSEHIQNLINMKRAA